MKKIMILVVMSLNIILAFAKEKINIKVVSQEENSVNVSRISLVLEYDTIPSSDVKLWKVGFPTTHWKIVEQGALLKNGGVYKQQLFLEYNHSQLPFYAKELILVHPFLSNITFYIYFTPYNTIETWNHDDYQNAKRLWFADSGEQKERKNISKNLIPISNVPDSVEYTDENVSYQKIDGLAYYVPMLKTEVSSTSTQKIAASHYEGVLQGRVLGTVRNDETGVFEERSMEGLRVSLKRYYSTGILDFIKATMSCSLKPLPN